MIFLIILIALFFLALSLAPVLLADTSDVKEACIRFPALRAGAISYLLKDVESEELTAAIRKATQGEAVLDSRVASRIIQELQGIRKEEVNPFTELSEREFEVLRLVAAGKSNAEIAETLVLGESTIKNNF